jgi:hypothetical protein
MILGLVMLSVAPAGAQWTERTVSWTSQGLQPFSGLVADPATDTIYYLKGTTVMSYDPATDIWSDLDPVVATGAVGYGHYERAFWTATGQAGRVVTFYDDPQVDVYDAGTNIWYRNPLPTDTYEFSWAQGALYNPLNGIVWCFWTDNVDDTHALVGAPYDPATDIWGQPVELRFPQDYFWGRMKSATVGTFEYTMDDDATFIGRHLTFRMYSLLQTPAFPVEEPAEWATVYDLGEGRALAAGGLGLGTAFNTQVMAVIGTDIFLSGVEASDLTVVYHTATDTWYELAPRPEDDPAEGLRDHTSTAAAGVVYVRDGSEFWTLAAPFFADGFESASVAAWSAATTVSGLR